MEAADFLWRQRLFLQLFLQFNLAVKGASLYALLMRYATPFFKPFGPLLFGRPPVSPLAHAFAKFSQCSSLSLLRKVFGSYIPQGPLGQQPSGEHSRSRIYSLDVAFWAFFDQVQTPNGSCREAVRKVMAFTRGLLPGAKGFEMSPDTSAYCQARAKIPLDTLDTINTHLVDRLHVHLADDMLWHGRRVRLVDGTGISMPDTEANQACWPQPSSQKPGCGFPSMNLVGLFCLQTGALIKSAHSDRHTHESRLFKSIWSSLDHGDLLVGDRGFCSFGSFAGLLDLGVDSLMRLPERKIRRAIGDQLPKTTNFDVIVTWKRPAQRIPSMTPGEFALLPGSVRVRVIRYTIAQPGFRTQSVTLVTTLLDTDIPAEDLAALYFRRWGIELHFREIKIHLNMGVLRCLSPHMIERELRLHFIAYNLIRCVMQEAAMSYDVALERLSFKGCLDTVRQFANTAAGIQGKPKAVSAMIDEMLLAIARDLNPHRPARSEPRVRKRRPKNYRLMTKPRQEMGPLPHRKDGVENHPKSSLT